MAQVVKFTTRMPQWVDSQQIKNDRVILQMATDIHRTATLNAPVDKGTLVRSARIVRNGLASYSIVFGGGSVKYAKRRHFENKKHPGTLRYLERAGDSVSRNFRRYYGATR